MPHIVIVGAGFVGLSTARRLQKSLPKDTKLTVIDGKDQFLFTPRLIDALENPDYPRTSLRADLRAIAKRDGFNFIQGRVTTIDREQRTLTYTVPTSSSRTETTTYDVLILSHGAQPCFYGIPGAQEYALPLKSEEDVHHLRDRVQQLLEKAERTTSNEERKHLLSFVVVGAGPSGVEAICALKLMVEKRCKEAHAALTPHLSWTLIQAGPDILPGFPTNLIAQAKQALITQGVNVRVGEAVTALNETQIATAKEMMDVGCVVWTAGIEPSRIAISPEIHTDRAGYLPVDATLSIAQNVFGAGDVILYREGNVVIPKNAQTAIKMSKTLANNVLRTILHKPLLPFHYASKGNILTTGKTGFLDLKFLLVQTRLTPFIRNALYRLRFWQVTGT